LFLKIIFCSFIIDCNCCFLEVFLPPYEVVETGWGEFEVGIRIYFRDPSEQPIDLFHQLKLYPSTVPLTQKKAIKQVLHVS
jgi:transcription initiation factor IIF auxiliary subunit